MAGVHIQMLLCAAACSASLAAAAAGTPSGAAFEDPRQNAEVDGQRIRGTPTASQGLPDSAEVVVWDSGAAPWARSAAMRASGGVILEAGPKTHGLAVTLLPPHPIAYGRFGDRIAAAGRWLAVLEQRTGRVWVYDLTSLAAAPVEVTAVAGRALALSMDDGELYVGCDRVIRVFRLGGGPPSDEADILAPPGASGVFSGQLTVEGDVLATTSAGLGTGDGYRAPGRVDVFRRTPGGWRWEGRIAPYPDASSQPYGSDCCIALRNGVVEVSSGASVDRFQRVAGGWQRLVEAKP
jgi:hypothetical protein